MVLIQSTRGKDEVRPDLQALALVVLSAWNDLFQFLCMTVSLLSSRLQLTSHLLRVAHADCLIYGSLPWLLSHALCALAKSYSLRALVLFIAVSLLPRRIPGTLSVFKSVELMFEQQMVGGAPPYFFWSEAVFGVRCEHHACTMNQLLGCLILYGEFGFSATLPSYENIY